MDGNVRMHVISHLISSTADSIIRVLGTLLIQDSSERDWQQIADNSMGKRLISSTSCLINSAALVAYWTAGIRAHTSNDPGAGSTHNTRPHMAARGTAEPRGGSITYVRPRPRIKRSESQHSNVLWNCHRTPPSVKTLRNRNPRQADSVAVIDLDAGLFARWSWLCETYPNNSGKGVI